MHSLYDTKPEGVWFIVTNYGNVHLSDEEHEKVLEILKADMRSSRNRLEKEVLFDFFNLIAKDEFLAQDAVDENDYIKAYGWPVPANLTRSLRF